MLQTNLTKLLQNLVKTHGLDLEIKIKDLLNRFPTPGRFYTLPKIHKPGFPPPGRPIISGNGTVTEIVSSFVDYFLKDLVKTLPSFIQDTTDILRKFEDLNREGPQPPNSFLATLDVVSLYPNIPHSEGLEACELYLNKRQNKTIPTTFLISLIQFVLENNNFVFNDKHYLQIQGTAMGTKMAPSYACLFMGFLEQKLLAKAPHVPKLWKRFIDDIFIIWTHGLKNWEIFLEYLNNSHPSIKFVSTISTQAVPFLDINVTLHNGSIETDLYSKPTDSHNYLSWDSCHPQGTKKSIPYSQALRIRRICSKESDFRKRLYQLEGYLRSCGYRSKDIKLAFDKVKAISRADTLGYKTRAQNSRITFPITYHPNLRNLPGTLFDKYKNTLLRDPKNKEIFTEPPMIAYRRPQNLRDKITRAIIKQPRMDPPGFRNCQSPDCQLHDLTNESANFISTATKKSYQTIQNLNCDSHNVIYLISCKIPLCKQQYVGETGRKLKDRAKEHLYDISINKDCPVAFHFNMPNHSVSNFSIQAIEMCRKNSTGFRKAREKEWLRILKPQINKQHSRTYRTNNYPREFKVKSRRSRFQRHTFISHRKPIRH